MRDIDGVRCRIPNLVLLRTLVPRVLVMRLIRGVLPLRGDPIHAFTVIPPSVIVSITLIPLHSLLPPDLRHRRRRVVARLIV